MNEHRLLHALGDVDDELIADAGRHTTPLRFLRYGAAAAAFVLLAVGATLLPWGTHTPPLVDDPTSSTATTDGHPTEGPTNTTAAEADRITEAGADATDVTENAQSTTTVLAIGKHTTKQQGNVTTPATKAEIALIPQWEDMTLPQKYTEAVWNDATYTASSNAVDKAQVGASLATVTVQGYDIYTDKSYTHTATLYRLTGINPACAVAVQYAGDTAYYPARNFRYKPDTLGQFIDDLSLRENLTVGKVDYDYLDEDGNFHSTTYIHLPAEAVWTMLLDDTTLQNVYDQQKMYPQLVGIAIDVPILGHRNISLAVTEDGYLTTNILDTGKAFFIGEEKAAAFLAYVLENCALDSDHIFVSTPADPDGSPEGTEETVTATTRTRPAYKPE